VSIRRSALGLLLLAGPLFAQEPGAQKEPAALDPAFVVGAPKGGPLTGAALDSRVQDVAALLRCPVCQGLSVADSPATMATNMRAEVRSLLAAGYEEDQILAYFERSYGEFVRLRPPLRGVNWLVWLGPLFGLLAGGAVVFAALRRSGASAAPAVSSTGSTAAPLPGRDTLPDDPRLAAAVLRVREEAYGWPGGKSPGGTAP
jgi:cytochrome c-type biogenesis protein CcmH